MLPGVAKRVVLHVGAMKSGTSFIQNVLHRNREVLKEHDVLFAGRRWRQQVLAVRELIGAGGADQPPLAPDGPWNRLVRGIDQWPGTAVVSMEFLGPRGRDKIAIIQEAFAGSDLQIVLTARDLARSLPAMWVESTQNRGVKEWPEFLDSVRDEDSSPGPGRAFWKHQRLSAMAERWSTAVGHDHFTLVTVPPKGAPPTLLWDRFAQVAGIPAGLCDLQVRSNPQLDAASAMVLREVNVRLEAAGYDRAQYDRVVKGILAKQGMVQRARDHEPLGLDERWVRREGRAELKRLDELGLQVVGDLAELEPRTVPGVHTRKISAEEQRDAAVDGLVFLLQRLMSQDSATTEPEE